MIEIIFDPNVPSELHWDKRWKKIAKWFGFKPKHDRMTYTAYKLPNGRILMHSQFEEKLKNIKGIRDA